LLPTKTIQILIQFAFTGTLKLNEKFVIPFIKDKKIN